MKTKKSKRVPFPFKNPELASLSNEKFDDYEGPITLRQLYYRLVSENGLPNNQRSYGNFIKHMTTVRKLGWVAWNKIIDPDRQLEKPSSWLNSGAFFKTVRNAYKRNLQQGQEFHVEVWCEKSVAITHITDKFDIGLLSGGGYQSGSSLYEAGERYKDIGKPVKILYLGDFDPSGFDIQRDIENRLRTIFHIEIEMIRVLLLQEDIKKYNLLPNLTKPTDPRAKEFVSQYGLDTYELDALSPSVLAEKLETAICENIDVELYEAQLAQQEIDNIKIGKFMKTLNARESY